MSAEDVVFSLNFRVLNVSFKVIIALVVGMSNTRIRLALR
jgi:hypothetical protein